VHWDQNLSLEGTGFQFMQVILNKDFIDWDFRRGVLDTS
jgi:hypothetical protein